MLDNVIGNKVAQAIGGKVFPKIGTDWVVVQRKVYESDGAGGQRLTWTDSDPIPCVYRPSTRRSLKTVVSDAMQAQTFYTVEFPCVIDGVRIDVLEQDRLKILEREFEPEKLLKVIGIPNDAGVVFSAECVLENQ